MPKSKLEGGRCLIVIGTEGPNARARDRQTRFCQSLRQQAQRIQEWYRIGADQLPGLAQRRSATFADEHGEAAAGELAGDRGAGNSAASDKHVIVLVQHAVARSQISPCRKLRRGGT